MATWYSYTLQDSATPLMEYLSFFHDHTLLILLMITVLVVYIMLSLFLNKFNYRFLLENQLIELIWTILPAITLIFIALPSLQLLYLLDELNNPLMSIKTLGHQWYWSYEYSDFLNVEFDSYMKDSKIFRLIDTDSRVILPFLSQIRMMISSSDVIHAWTMPTLSIKMDALPGRLNQISFFINRSSLFFGQCSEICGMNHSFMPITIESISPLYFISWIKS
uniref:Cytochrome c oxidase subunit 2 n=1 Tax=Leptaulax koreanus TaxID=2607329 RepID=A0A5C0XNC8_9SCAR|nr:cytochrome c oxidase subunit II [Leptaulax koreanus]QEK77354.1 cytochrome c oxidase subunit II [Leptaulax koreanus]